MPQAIIRVAKIKTQSQATGKTKHNYRLMPTPNADPERTASLNQELVNTAQLDYWTLAEKRREEGIAKTARGKPRTVRADQVRAVEIVLTASPDWFKRDADRQAEDMRGSDWVADNLNFLKNKYGEKNLVSFTLHQDETTPHIHAVVVPLTDKGRLSAETLFNRETLRDLQTEYAQAMAPHGLERGVKGSRRHHLDMKQMYGLQDKTAVELGPLAQPVATVPAQAVQLNEVPLLGRDTWRELEQARINADLVRQVQEANERTDQANRRAQEAIQYAIANAGSQEKAEVLRRQLNISEGLKQDQKAESDDMAKRMASGETPPAKLVKDGNKLLDEAIKQLRDGRESVATFQRWGEEATWRGDTKGQAEQRNGLIKEQEAKNKVLEADLGRYAGGRTRLEELNKERDKAIAKKEQQAAAHAQWVKEAPAREAQQKRDQEQQEKLKWDSEKLKIEQICGEVMKKDTYFMSLEWFAVAGRERGLQVEIPSDGQLVLSIPGSKNRFKHQDLQLGGKEFAEVLNKQMQVNKDQDNRERGVSNDRGRS